MKAVQVLAVIFVCAVGSSLYAQGTAGKEITQHPRWSISAGAMIRSIEADMHIPAPAFDWGAYMNAGRTYGMGDRGLFTAGREGDVHFRIGPASIYVGSGISYENGNVGIISASGNLNGLDPVDADLVISGALAVFDSMDQFDVYAAIPYEEGVDILLGQVHYTSEGTSYSHHVDGGFQDVSGTDEETGIGPYINVRYQIRDKKRHALNALFGVGMVETEHSTSRSLGNMTVTEYQVETDYSYRYSGATIEGAGELLGIDSELGIVVVDPFYIDPELIDEIEIGPYEYAMIRDLFLPSQTSTSTVAGRRSRDFYAMGRSNLDVRLYELAFALELTGQATDSLSYSLAAGPTLNIIEGDLTASTVVYQSGIAGPIYSERYSSSDEELRLGVMTRASLLYDFGRDDRFFVETFIGYNWVDEATFSAGPAEADVDASSFSGGAGVGIRL